jgi:hypothetical protein
VASPFAPTSSGCGMWTVHLDRLAVGPVSTGTTRSSSAAAWVPVDPPGAAQGRDGEAGPRLSPRRGRREDRKPSRTTPAPGPLLTTRVDTWDEVLRGLTDPVDRLLSVFDAVALFRRREGNRRGCAFLAAATELPPHHPGQRGLAPDTRLLTDRLRELAAAAGFRDADEIAVHLLVLYDGTLARWAREATVADLPGGDPLARARGLAAIVVAAVQPGRADVGPSGPSTTTVHNVSDSAGPM